MNKANILKICSYVAKLTGLLASFNTIPFIPAEYGILIFAGASLLKDTVNRIGDIVDDGKVNDSFKG